MEVEIFDTTLRDGEQTPGTSFSIADKVQIARRLDQLGVHVIEAGFPINSAQEQEAVREVVGAVDTKVCGLARVKEMDIDAVVETGVDMVHLFIPTSKVQMEKSMHTTREEALELSVRAVEYVKDHGVMCMYSPMDATRTELDYLLEVCRGVEEAGADIINIPDTVGIGHPPMIRELLRRVREGVKTRLSIHCHNDFGLAVANSLAAVEGGATMVQVSVNGIGERAGNAALEEVVMALECLYRMDIGIKTELIYELSKLVERLSGVQTAVNKSIVGANAFSHESGIHAAGVIEEAATFEPGIMVPEMVGHRRRLVMGKHTGKRSVKRALEDAGLLPTEEELSAITERIKSLGSKGKRITDADLYTIAESIMSNLPQREELIALGAISVMTGSMAAPTASIKARIGGEYRTAAAVGVGPVDAALKAVGKILSEGPKIEISGFHIDAISGGSDAVAGVTVVVEDEFGRTADARAANEDIVIASVEAIVAAINHLVRKKRH